MAIAAEVEADEAHEAGTPFLVDFGFVQKPMWRVCDLTETVPSLRVRTIDPGLMGRLGKWLRANMTGTTRGNLKRRVCHM